MNRQHCDSVTGHTTRAIARIGANVTDHVTASSLITRRRTLHPAGHMTPRERECFIDNLLIRFQSGIEMIFVDRPCTMGG